MKALALLTLSFVLYLPAERIPVNPYYDFPETLIANATHDRIYTNRVMQALSIASYYRQSLVYEDSFAGAPIPIALSMEKKKMVEAHQFIIDQAKNYRILILNENHIRPQHRLYVKSLLHELHREGYNFFMAEGIWFHNTIAAKGYPTSGDGQLLNEPNYASLIRYAMREGYKIAAYEQASEKKEYWDDSIKLDKYGSIKYISYNPRDSVVLIYDKNGLQNTIFTSVRERVQAENIFKIVQQNPSSKFVILAGHGHLYEEGPMMGAKLKALLNYEDILTFDEVSLTDRVLVIDSSRRDTIRSAFPYLLYDSGKAEYYNSLGRGQVDYTIFNAHVRDSLSRPYYLFTDVEHRNVYHIPANRVGGCPCVFTAYNAKEYAQAGAAAIAVDNIYGKDDDLPPLLLYAGDYVIVRKKREGGVTCFKVTIPGSTKEKNARALRND